MIRPVAKYTKITSRHGDAGSGYYGRHLGTDYAVPVGTVVRAPIAGTVARTGKSSEVGNFIEINGTDGRLHRLLHLSRIDVRGGQKVKEGQNVALSGGAKGTDNSSTGPHLHWDARKGGTDFYSGFANYFDTEKLLTPPKPPAKPRFPMTVTTTGEANVRKAPNLKAPLSGSRLLKKGEKFTSVGLVKGDSVGGNNLWHKSSFGNYVWSGNTNVKK